MVKFIPVYKCGISLRPFEIHFEIMYLSDSPDLSQPVLAYAI